MLMRRLETTTLEPEFVAVLDSPPGKRAVVRRLEMGGTDIEEEVAKLDTRIRRLKAIAHPALVPVLQGYADGGAYYAVEDRCDQISLRAIIERQKQAGKRLPAPVFLHIAIQACRAVEALHQSSAKSKKELMLHEALCPEALFLDSRGTCRLGNYRLSSLGASWTTGSLSIEASHLAYLSPEQTTSRRLHQSSDIFSLGVTLYELWSLKHMFLAESTLQTLQRIRTGQVTANLTDVRDSFRGLDRVLYRALSLNPRHRYQRMFVLKEDLRALMAGYSFVNIAEETAALFRPLFGAVEAPLDPEESSTSKSVSTASLLSRLVAEHRAAEAEGEPDSEEAPTMEAESTYEVGGEQIEMLSLPEPSAHELGDPNDPDTISEDDTAALMRDLSRQRANEEEYAPTHHLSPLDTEDEGSTSAISIVPIPMPPSKPDETSPILREPSEAATDVLDRSEQYLINMDEDDLDTTAVGTHGDTVPIPRPLSAPTPAPAVLNEDPEPEADDDMLVLPEPLNESEASFSIYKPRSQALPMVLLFLFAGLVFCTGSIGTAAWIFSQTR